MIVRHLDNRWIIVNQDDHAHHAGALAVAWGNGPFGPLPTDEHLVTATQLHDNGWIGRDARPSLNPETGGPLNFALVRDQEHASFYRQGVEKVAGQDPIAGYLVSLHASGIYSGRYGWSGLEAIAWPEISEEGQHFLGQQRTFRAALLAALPRANDTLVEFETLWQAYMLLQTFDYLSLMCCLGPFSAGCAPVPFGFQLGRLHAQLVSPWSLALDPFPFVGSELRVVVRVRDLPGEQFADEEELRRAIDKTPMREQTTAFVRVDTSP